MKLLFYGDSNTYGYDPRGPIPGRYDFIDNHWWNIPLAYDGAHFSRRGHHVFAKHIERELKSMFQGMTAHMQPKS